MVKRTPFHDRLAPMNRPEIWEHWAGYLAAPRFEYSDTVEYYAIRNSVALFDTSPLFKYRISGRDAEELLSKLMIRDIRTCAVGRAQYTAWCNEAGFVMEDGVVLRTNHDQYLLTTAEPNLRYFSRAAEGLQVTVEDVSNDYGIVALQGPHSISVLRQLSDDVEPLPYFGVARTRIAGVDVIVSRTGFTGDLGYEIWVPSDDAEAVFDDIWSAGEPFNIAPIGSKALTMARIEAGLLLIDVDFHNARHAWTDLQRETPIELGWQWMLADPEADDRDFVGRAAIEREIADGTSRWKTVGFVVNWRDFDHRHREAGVLTPKDGLIIEDTLSVYRRSDTPWEYAGYATSFIWSPIRQQHIGLAKLAPDLCEPGSEVDLEVTIVKRPTNVNARVVELPFFQPSRKTARIGS